MDFLGQRSRALTILLCRQSAQNFPVRFLQNSYLPSEGRGPDVLLDSGFRWNDGM
jgi:hypothetical protein